MEERRETQEASLIVEQVGPEDDVPGPRREQGLVAVLNGPSSGGVLLPSMIHPRL